MSKAKRNRLELISDDYARGEDNRTFCRFTLDRVPVRFKDLKSGTRGEGVCRDFGGGGACIQGEGQMRPKTTFEMWFDFPDGFEPLHLLGRAVWSKDSGAAWRSGVAFDKQRLMSMSRILKLTT
jgi:hypothetical protein